MTTSHRWRSYIFTTIILSLITWVSVAQSPNPADDASAQVATVTTVLEGLRNPVDMALLPDGNVLIAEEGTGNDDHSAGVSLWQPLNDNAPVGRLVSGLSSSRDSGDLSGVALVSLAPDERTVYIGNFAQGHLWTLPVDLPLSLPDTPYTTDDFDTAFEPFNRVQLTNPFDMTYTADGSPIVTDASQDGVAQMLPDGRTQFFHRFDALIDPTNENLRLSPVPTGIERVDAEFYVTLTGGCPYPDGGGELVAIDTERNQRTVVDALNMPIDVAQAADGTLWVLEFARFAADGSCFSGQGYLPDSGRLSYLRDDGTLQPVAENLNFPSAVQPLPDGSLYVTQIFSGEVVHITFDDSTDSVTESSLPTINVPEPRYITVDNPDDMLQQIIDERGLVANPGADEREGDTELARLGRDLFFDPILSGDQNISCATCHHPSFAMGDGRVLPIGAGGVGLGAERDFLTHITLSAEYGTDAGEVPNPAIGTFVPRNSPTILNSALLPVQFWDGRVDGYAGMTVQTLEDGVNALGLTDVLITQALFPIISRDEMAGATFGEEDPAIIRQHLAERLMAIPAYRAAFSDIFGTETITPVQIVSALAAFERQLIFTNGAWDRYLAGNRYALTPQQKRGALLFYGELNPQMNCATCHSGDLFTDLNFHNLLVPQLGPGKGNGTSGREDWGRANVTFDWRNRFQFRTPSLRNVTLTAPYFHSGAYQSLEEVLRHHANIFAGAANYDPSAHLPPEFHSSLRPYDPASQTTTIAPELANGLPMSDDDIDDVIAFLHSLTDSAASELDYLVPESVPSGLPLDPLPQSKTDSSSRSAVDSDDIARTSDEASDDTAQAWQFRDVASDVGLDFTHGAFQYAIHDDPAAMMGAGLCWIDIDNDGWLDLYAVNSYAHAEADRLRADDALPHNQLYHNNGGTFTPINAGTRLSMRGNGCIAADFNRDGWSDLYITADGADVLLQNQGDGTFSDVTHTAGLGAPEWTSAAAVGDLNGDGWLDLFVGAYIDLENQIPNPMGAFPQDYFGLADRLYLSDGLNAEGNLTFTEVSQTVGLLREERTLGALLTDVDRDNDLDLYIANDGQPNRLYENVPDDSEAGFRFVDLTDTAQVGDAGSGMGVAGGDYDNDGYFDLFVTNWEAELNALYRNETAEQDRIQFRYSTYRIGMMGLGRDMTGWGTTWADFDHDTDLDLLIVNGRVPISNWQTDPELVRLYGNQLVERTQPHYREWTERVGLEALGTLMARGSAVADYDNDGDLDVAINSIGGDMVLLEHSGTSQNSLQVRLPQAMPGTVVTVTLPDGQTLVREQHIGSSYLASEDPRLHIGVGEADILPQVAVQLPDGTRYVFEDVTSNQVFFIVRSD